MTDVILNTPSAPVARILFAHGAGAPMDSDVMNALAGYLCDLQLAVVRFEFPYMAQRRQTGGRRAPNPFPQIVAHFEQRVAQWQGDEMPLFVAGKSMGGRAAASVASGVRGAIAYGYPLHPAGKPDKLRTEPLTARNLPLCIVQGQRDALGDEVTFTRLGPWPQVQLHWLADGDHDLKPRKRSGHTHTEHLKRAAEITLAFVQQHSR